MNFVTRTPDFERNADELFLMQWFAAAETEPLAPHLTEGSHCSGIVSLGLVIGNPSSRMRWFLMAANLCLLVGCARRHVSPQLEARHCDKGSYPVQALYHGEVTTVCAILAPECARNAKQGQTCPIVGYIRVGEVNTFLDPDADEAAKDAPGKRRWWQIWKRSKTDSD